MFLVSHLRNLCLPKGHKDFFPMFSFRCFIVFGFIFNLMMRFGKKVCNMKCISKIERKRGISMISMNVRHFLSNSLSSLEPSLSTLQCSLLGFRVYYIQGREFKEKKIC